MVPTSFDGWRKRNGPAFAKREKSWHPKASVCAEPSDSVRDFEFDNPRTWRERAKEARMRAERLREASSRAMLFEIAETFDQLAERAEKLGFRDRDHLF